MHHCPEIIYLLALHKIRTSYNAAIKIPYPIRKKACEYPRISYIFDPIVYLHTVHLPSYQYIVWNYFDEFAKVNATQNQISPTSNQIVYSTIGQQNFKNRISPVFIRHAIKAPTRISIANSMCSVCEKRDERRCLVSIKTTLENSIHIHISYIRKRVILLLRTFRIEAQQCVQH